MPVYFLNSSSADLANKFYMFSQQNATSSYVVSMGSQATVTVDFITPVFLPNNNTSSFTTASVTIAHSVTNGNVNIAAQLYRTNAAGTLLASGSITSAAGVATAALNTLSVPEPRWSGSCSDRLLLRLSYINGAMANRSITMTLDTTGSICSSTINPNNTSCSILRKVEIT